MRMGAYIAYLRHVYVGIRLRPKAVTFCSSDRHRDINSLFFFFFNSLFLFNNNNNISWEGHQVLVLLRDKFDNTF